MLDARPAPPPRHGRLDRHDMGTVGRGRMSRFDDGLRTLREILSDPSHDAHRGLLMVVWSGGVKESYERRANPVITFTPPDSKEIDGAVQMLDYIITTIELNEVNA